jgi:hypothetical protein
MRATKRSHSFPAGTPRKWMHGQSGHPEQSHFGTSMELWSSFGIVAGDRRVFLRWTKAFATVAGLALGMT